MTNRHLAPTGVAGVAGLAAALVAVTPGLEAQDRDPEASPVAPGEMVEACRGDAHRASDYALGEWAGTVKVPGPDGRLEVDPTVRSEAELELSAGGCAIVERRAVYREGREPSRILTVRAYDPDEERWHQVLVSSRPVVLRFRGERGERGLRFVTARPGNGGLVRVTDRRADPAGFDRIIESSEDGGTTWTLEDVVEYRRP